MNRPAGVIVSAVFLILGSVLTALMGLLMLFARSFAPPATPQTPFYDAIMIGSAVVFLGFATWGGLAAFGLFRLRPWARISILVIGALVVIFCGFSLAMLFFISQQTPEIEAGGRAGTILGVTIGMYVIPMLLGFWWLIYFNLAVVKATFLQGVAPDTGSRRPLSIAVIAWHFVAFGLLTPIGLWIHFPAFFLGMVLTGWSAAVIYCIYAVAELSIGVGLLRLRPWSLTAAMWLLIFGIVNSIVSAFVPNSAARIFAAMQAAMPTISSQARTTEPPSPVLNAALGMLFMLLPMFYLATRKHAFLEAGKAAQASATGATAAPAP